MLWIKVDGFGVEDEDLKEFKYLNNDKFLRAAREKKTIKIGNSKFKGYIEEGDQVLLVDDKKLDTAYTAMKAYRNGYNQGLEEGIKRGKKEIEDKVNRLLFEKETCDDSGED